MSSNRAAKFTPDISQAVFQLFRSFLWKLAIEIYLIFMDASMEFPIFHHPDTSLPRIQHHFIIRWHKEKRCSRKTSCHTWCLFTFVLHLLPLSSSSASSVGSSVASRSPLPNPSIHCHFNKNVCNRNKVAVKKVIWDTLFLFCFF